MEQLWGIYEKSKRDRTGDNMDISEVIHNLTQEKRKLQDNYQKLVAEVNRLFDAKEQRVLEFNYKQIKRGDEEERISLS